ncbi:MAG: hypothetical protein IKV48_00335, partial [Eggerthellaceae bacterium]|nr:hypothetical protein [Eggerthellaceae bacterium]
SGKAVQRDAPPLILALTCGLGFGEATPIRLDDLLVDGSGTKPLLQLEEGASRFMNTIILR